MAAKKDVQDSRLTAVVVQREKETIEDYIQRLRFSARGYKGALTTKIESTVKLLGLQEAGPSPFYITCLKDEREALDKAIAQLRERMQDLLDVTTNEKDYNALKEDLGDYEKRYQKCIEKVIQEIATAKKPPLARITDGANWLEDDENDDGALDEDEEEGVPRAKKGKAKPDLASKPEKLTSENTPAEMRDWAEQFRSYFETSNFGCLSKRSQQSYFKNCLDSTLRLRLYSKIDYNTPIFGAEDSCMAHLQAEFMKRYPLFKRRLLFFQAEQEQGQLMSDFILKLRRLADEADTHKIGPDRNAHLSLFVWMHQR